MPRDIVGTDWGPIANTCRKEMGIEFDGWQDGMGQLMLAKNPQGTLAHTVGGFHLSASRQIGKALALDTEVLTANRGWTTMADIHVGDRVLHPSGYATMVTEVHPVRRDRDCYEVITTDGRRIIADAEHLWTVSDKRFRAVRNLTTIEMLTEGIDRSINGSRTTVTDGKQYRTHEYRFGLPRQEAIVSLAESDLPIDPYLLGAWLGNGDAHAAALTSGTEDIDHWNAVVRNAGFIPRSTLQERKQGSAWHISIRDDEGMGRQLRSFQGLLRELNLVRNKHIPDQYLVGSVQQRLALLQGLLDTDGHITKQGTIEFCSMTKNLAEGVLFLSRSLGWRSTIREGKAKLDGRDYGIKYRITFTPKLSDQYVPFLLPRKQDRIRSTDGGKGRFTVAIKSIEPVASVPVRCIKVAAEDGLFLAGRDLIATHNTYFGAGSLFGLCQHYPGLLVIWTAHHSTTSDETFEAMQGFAARRMVVPFIQKIYTGSGDEEIKFWNGSRILFGARERGFGRGMPGVDVLFFDEAQILSEKAMQALLATMNTSWLGLHIHAGTPPPSEELHKAQHWMRARDEAWANPDPLVIQTETDDLVWVEFGADDDAELDDIRQWYKCNPSVPHRTPIHSIQRLRRNLNDDGFRREGLGLYDKTDASIFDLTKWGRLGKPDAPQPERGSLVVDVSPDREWASIGICGEYDDEHTLVMVKSMKGTKGVAEAVDDLNEKRNLISIHITPNAARSLETRLTKLGVPYEIMAQTAVNAAYGDLQEAIKFGTVYHLEQAELTVGLKETKSRFLQTGEAESFDRRESVGGPDTSPAVAVACALYQFGINNDPMPFFG